MEDKILVPHIENEETFLEEEVVEYKEVKKERRKKHLKKRIFRLLILLGIVAVYFISDLSNVKKVNVVNENILSKEEVIKAVGIHSKSKFLLLHDIFKKPANNIFIEDYSIINHFQGEITIDVKEIKLVGYIVHEENIEFISEKAKKMNSKILPDYIIRLPKVNSIEEVFIEKLSVNLGKIDQNVIARISEIQPYETSYDKNMVILIMEDGNKIYSSMNDLHLMNKYNHILESISGTNQCIQLDDATNSAYKFKCP